MVYMIKVIVVFMHLRALAHRTHVHITMLTEKRGEEDLELTWPVYDGSITEPKIRFAPGSTRSYITSAAAFT
jgi:hypothetical protein